MAYVVGDVVTNFVAQMDGWTKQIDKALDHLEKSAAEPIKLAFVVDDKGADKVLKKIADSTDEAKNKSDEVKGAFGNAVDEIFEKVEDLVDRVTEEVQSVEQEVEDKTDDAREAFEDQIETFFEFFRTKVDNVLEVVERGATGAFAFVVELTERIRAYVPESLRWLIDWFLNLFITPARDGVLGLLGDFRKGSDILLGFGENVKRVGKYATNSLTLGQKLTLGLRDTWKAFTNFLGESQDRFKPDKFDKLANIAKDKGVLQSLQKIFDIVDMLYYSLLAFSKRWELLAGNTKAVIGVVLAGSGAILSVVTGGILPVVATLSGSLLSMIGITRNLFTRVKLGFINALANMGNAKAQLFIIVQEVRNAFSVLRVVMKSVTKFIEDNKKFDFVKAIQNFVNLVVDIRASLQTIVSMGQTLMRQMMDGFTLLNQFQQSVQNVGQTTKDTIQSSKDLATKAVDDVQSKMVTSSKDIVGVWDRQLGTLGRVHVDRFSERSSKKFRKAFRPLTGNEVLDKVQGNMSKMFDPLRKLVPTLFAPFDKQARNVERKFVELDEKVKARIKKRQDIESRQAQMLAAVQQSAFKEEMAIAKLKEELEQKRNARTEAQAKMLNAKTQQAALRAQRDMQNIERQIKLRETLLEQEQLLRKVMLQGGATEKQAERLAQLKLEVGLAQKLRSLSAKGATAEEKQAAIEESTSKEAIKREKERILAQDKQFKQRKKFREEAVQAFNVQNMAAQKELENLGRLDQKDRQRMTALAKEFALMEEEHKLNKQMFKARVAQVGKEIALQEKRQTVMLSTNETLRKFIADQKQGAARFEQNFETAVLGLQPSFLKIIKETKQEAVKLAQDGSREVVDAIKRDVAGPLREIAENTAGDVFKRFVNFTRTQQWTSKLGVEIGYKLREQIESALATGDLQTVFKTIFTKAAADKLITGNQWNTALNIKGIQTNFENLGKTLRAVFGDEKVFEQVGDQITKLRATFFLEAKNIEERIKQVYEQQGRKAPKIVLAQIRQVMADQTLGTEKQAREAGERFLRLFSSGISDTRPLEDALKSANDSIKKVLEWHSPNALGYDPEVAAYRMMSMFGKGLGQGQEVVSSKLEEVGDVFLKTLSPEPGGKTSKAVKNFEQHFPVIFTEALRRGLLSNINVNSIGLEDALRSIKPEQLKVLIEDLVNQGILESVPNTSAILTRVLNKTGQTVATNIPKMTWVGKAKEGLKAAAKAVGDDVSSSVGNFGKSKISENMKSWWERYRWELQQGQPVAFLMDTFQKGLEPLKEKTKGWVRKLFSLPILSEIREAASGLVLTVRGTVGLALNPIRGAFQMLSGIVTLNGAKFREGFNRFFITPIIHLSEVAVGVSRVVGAVFKVTKFLVSSVVQEMRFVVKDVWDSVKSTARGISTVAKGMLSAVVSPFKKYFAWRKKKQEEAIEKTKKALVEEQQVRKKFAEEKAEQARRVESRAVDRKKKHAEELVKIEKQIADAEKAAASKAKSARGKKKRLAAEKKLLNELKPAQQEYQKRLARSNELIAQAKANYVTYERQATESAKKIQKLEGDTSDEMKKYLKDAARRREREAKAKADMAKRDAALERSVAKKRRAVEDLMAKSAQKRRVKTAESAANLVKEEVKTAESAAKQVVQTKTSAAKKTVQVAKSATKQEIAVRNALAAIEDKRVREQKLREKERAQRSERIAKAEAAKQKERDKLAKAEAKAQERHEKVLESREKRKQQVLRKTLETELKSREKFNRDAVKRMRQRQAEIVRAEKRHQKELDAVRKQQRGGVGATKQGEKEAKRRAKAARKLADDLEALQVTEEKRRQKNLASVRNINNILRSQDNQLIQRQKESSKALQRTSGMIKTMAHIGVNNLDDLLTKFQQVKDSISSVRENLGKRSVAGALFKKFVFGDKGPLDEMRKLSEQLRGLKDTQVEYERVLTKIANIAKKKLGATIKKEDGKRVIELYSEGIDKATKERLEASLEKVNEALGGTLRFRSPNKWGFDPFKEGANLLMTFARGVASKMGAFASQFLAPILGKAKTFLMDKIRRHGPTVLAGLSVIGRHAATHVKKASAFALEAGITFWKSNFRKRMWETAKPLMKEAAGVVTELSKGAWSKGSKAAVAFWKTDFRKKITNFAGSSMKFLAKKFAESRIKSFIPKKTSKFLLTRVLGMDPQSVDKGLKAIDNKIKSFFFKSKDKADKYGQQTVNKYSEGVRKGQPKLVTSMKEVSDKLDGSLRFRSPNIFGFDPVVAGKSLLKGFAFGIGLGMPKVLALLAKMFVGATKMIAVHWKKVLFAAFAPFSIPGGIVVKGVKFAMNGLKKLQNAFKAFMDLPIIQFVRNISKELLDVGRAAERAGIGVAEFDSFSKSLGKAGVQATQLETVMNTLGRNIADALNDPLGDNAQLLQRAGINLEQLRNGTLTTVDVYKALSTQIRNTSRTSEDYNKILSFTASSFGTLKNAIMLGGDEIDRTQKMLEKTGAVVGEDDVDKAQEFHETTLGIKRAFESIKREVAVNIMPPLLDGLNYVRAWFRANSGPILSIMESIGRIISISIDAVSKKFVEWGQNAGLFTKELSEGMTAVTESLVDTLSTVVNHLPKFVEEVIDALGVMLGPAFTYLIDMTMQVWLPRLSVRIVKWLMELFTNEIPARISGGVRFVMEKAAIIVRDGLLEIVKGLNAALSSIPLLGQVFGETAIDPDKAVPDFVKDLAAWAEGRTFEEYVEEQKQEYGKLADDFQKVIDEVDLGTKGFAEDARDEFKEATAEMPELLEAALKDLGSVTSDAMQEIVPQLRESFKNITESFGVGEAGADVLAEVDAIVAAAQKLRFDAVKAEDKVKEELLDYADYLDRIARQVEATTARIRGVVKDAGKIRSDLSKLFGTDLIEFESFDEYDAALEKVKVQIASLTNEAAGFEESWRKTAAAAKTVPEAILNEGESALQRLDEMIAASTSEVVASAKEKASAAAEAWTRDMVSEDMVFDPTRLKESAQTYDKVLSESMDTITRQVSAKAQEVAEAWTPDDLFDLEATETLTRFHEGKVEETVRVHAENLKSLFAKVADGSEEAAEELRRMLESAGDDTIESMTFEAFKAQAIEDHYKSIVDGLEDVSQVEETTRSYMESMRDLFAKVADGSEEAAEELRRLWESAGEDLGDVEAATFETFKELYEQSREQAQALEVYQRRLKDTANAELETLRNLQAAIEDTRPKVIELGNALKLLESAKVDTVANQLKKISLEAEMTTQEVKANVAALNAELESERIKFQGSGGQGPVRKAMLLALGLRDDVSVDQIVTSYREWLNEANRKMREQQARERKSNFLSAQLAFQEHVQTIVGTLDDLTVWDSLGSIFEGGGRLQAALDKIDIEAQQRGREVEDMMQSYRDAIELEIGILEKQAEALPENSEMVAELTEKIRELQAQLGELPTAYEAGQEATARFKEENDKLARAKPFEGLKSALSSAFSDAMLSAIKGETEWADAFGKMMSSLFDALVDDLVNSMTEKLADTLIEGLTQAFDWAGDAAAGLATAVFMIVSSLLKAGDEEIKAQRENIEDLVDQTEQVRGLISGDTTVALKEVGDQLSDALVPTNEKLDQIVVLLQLATRYSGGGLQASARGASSII